MKGIATAIILTACWLLFASIHNQPDPIPEQKHFCVELHCFVNEKLTVVYQYPIENDSAIEITKILPDSYQTWIKVYSAR